MILFQLHIYNLVLYAERFRVHMSNYRAGLAGSLVTYNPALELPHQSNDVIDTSYHSPTPTYSRHEKLMDLYEK